MTSATLRKYILTGRELEFSYHHKRYSITYSFEEDRRTISFCQFSQPCEDFSSMEQFLFHAKLGQEYLRDIVEQFEDIIVY